MLEKRHYFIFLILSLFLVLASLYLPKTFNDYNDLNYIVCGWPEPFITFASHRGLPDYAWTKECIGWLAGPPMDWGGDTYLRFLWLPFFLNIALVFSLLTLVFRATQLINKKSTK